MCAEGTEFKYEDRCMAIGPLDTVAHDECTGEGVDMCDECFADQRDLCDSCADGYF
jgi:hypothetical protein